MIYLLVITITFYAPFPTVKGHLDFPLSVVCLFDYFETKVKKWGQLYPMDTFCNALELNTRNVLLTALVHMYVNYRKEKE